MTISLTVTIVSLVALLAGVVWLWGVPAGLIVLGALGVSAGLLLDWEGE